MDQCLTLAISAQNFYTSDVQITQTVNTHEYENPELSTLHTPYFIPPITENGYLSLHSGGTTGTCYSLLPTPYYVQYIRTFSFPSHILAVLHTPYASFDLEFACLLACQPSSDHRLRVLSRSCPLAPSSSALAAC
jgi:hypothetical protein